MSLEYCYFCLDMDEENPDCENHMEERVFGERRCDYLRGYRDAEAGKEENI